MRQPQSKKKGLVHGAGYRAIHSAAPVCFRVNGQTRRQSAEDTAGSICNGSRRPAGGQIAAKGARGQLEPRWRKRGDREAKQKIGLRKDGSLDLVLSLRLENGLSREQKWPRVGIGQMGWDAGLGDGPGQARPARCRQALTVTASMVAKTGVEPGGRERLIG